ncbi:MAG: hypothetical protein ACK5JS_07620 [Mangrovibacterium sp.]
MKICIKEQSDNLIENHWFHQILTTLDGLECSECLRGLTKLSQPAQRTQIEHLQTLIIGLLEKEHIDFEWKSEHKISDNRDSVDIYGNRNNEIVIIELDKWRADQVAKKLISRTALMIDKKMDLFLYATEELTK